MPQAEPEQNIQYSSRLHVRKRPGMYFGGIGQKALEAMLYEIVENAINQVIRNDATLVTVTLHDDSQVTITDDGEGIPIDLHKIGLNKLELILTQVGTGPKLNKGPVKCFNIGIQPVNALSTKMKVQVKRDDYLWQQEFAEGIPTTELQQIRPLEDGEKTGTQITFKPDFTILEKNQFDYFALLQCFHDYTYMVSSLKIIFEDRRSNPQGEYSTTIYHPHGLLEYMEQLNYGGEVLHPIIHVHKILEVEDFRGNPEEVRVDLAMQYSKTAETRVLGYMNSLRMERNSRVLDPVRHVIRKEIHNWSANKTQLDKIDLLSGLTIVVSIWHPNPESESSTKWQPMNLSARETVQASMEMALKQLKTQHPEAIDNIIKHMESLVHDE